MLDDSEAPLRCPRTGIEAPALTGVVQRPSHGFGDDIRDSKIGAETGAESIEYDVGFADANLEVVVSDTDVLGVCNGVRLRGDSSVRVIREESLPVRQWERDGCRRS